MTPHILTAVKVFASLGVPGLVVGIIYVMIQIWGFELPRVPRGWAGPIVLVIVLSLSGLTYAVIDRVFPKITPFPVTPGSEPHVDKQVRFDTKYGHARFYPTEDGRIRADFAIDFLPVTKNNDEVATVILGMAAFADDEKVDHDEWMNHAEQCSPRFACIHPAVIWRWDQPHGEALVRGDTEGFAKKFSVYIPSDVHRIFLYWEFYQREGDDGAVCEVDPTRPAPKGGLPYVRTVKEGKVVHDWCYRSWGTQVVPVTLS